MEKAEVLAGIVLAWVVVTGGALFHLLTGRVRAQAEARRAYLLSLRGESPSVEQLEGRFKTLHLVTIILVTVLAVGGVVFVVSADPSQLKQHSR